MMLNIKQLQIGKFRKATGMFYISRHNIFIRSPCHDVTELRYNRKLVLRRESNQKFKYKPLEIVYYLLTSGHLLLRSEERKLLRCQLNPLEKVGSVTPLLIIKGHTEILDGSGEK